MKLAPPTRLRAILEGIVARHTACRDDRMEDLSDEPLAALRYLLAARGLPKPVQAADAADALTAIRLLREDLESLERRALVLARAAGMTWPEIAEVRGGTMQAAQQRLRDLKKRHREASGVEVLPDERTWLAQNAALIRSAAAGVIRSALPEDALDQAEDLAEALEEDEFRPREVVLLLRLVMGDLTVGGSLRCLDEPLRDLAVGLVETWDAVRDGKPDGGSQA